MFTYNYRILLLVHVCDFKTCNQMAYESLAMISSALSRLECGQLGIIRCVYSWSL